ncbi:MAG: response regulator transcription factor [Arcobacteraceae bacterium]
MKLETLKNLTLLNVDDDDALREDLKIMTSLFFKEVFTASNGAEGLKIFENKHIDVIMVDYVMPIMDGCEFTKMIREIDNSIPIVMLSSHSDREKLLNMISLNLTDYIIKPINYTELTLTLSNIADKLEKENILKIYIDDDIVYDRTTKSIIINNFIINLLTKSEAKIFELLLKNKNKIVTIDRIDELFDTSEIKSNSSIKNHIYKLRQKIGKDIIFNVKEIGYILKVKE